MAENPQEPHVEDNVEPAAMDEQRREERAVVVDVVSEELGNVEPQRDDAPHGGKFAELYLVQTQFNTEHDDIGQDEKPDGYRWVAAGDAAGNRYHVAFPFHLPRKSLEKTFQRQPVISGLVYRGGARDMVFR